MSDCNKWIKVSEHFPDEDINVIAYIPNHGIYMGNFSILGFGNKIFGFYAATTGDSEWFYDIDLVTHWMLLPAPPKDEE